MRTNWKPRNRVNTKTRKDENTNAFSCFRVFVFQFALVVAGCAGNYRAPGDPLLGGEATRPAGRAAALPAGPLPPLPAPSSTASNAALASAPLRPLDGRHDLRITSPGNGTEFTPVAVAQNRASPDPGGSKMTYEQVQARLATLGVTWQKLETANQGEWQFTCAVSNRQNPAISRTYQAQGRDSLAAIQAVLEQIEREQVSHE
jgi:hypothetical protein